MDIRDAATVMLVRPLMRDGGGEGVEVFTVRRRATMAFAPGTLAFPGGSVDAADADVRVPWSGPDPAVFAGQLNAGSADQARALVAAAVRETFEECGVLLAGTPGGQPLSRPLDDPEWEARRAALAAGTIGLADLLLDAGLELRADLLVPWAHWLTPEGNPRRYDTRFFVAAFPDGQLARDVAGEAASVEWWEPAAALAEFEAGRLPMFPPQRAMLADLATAGSVGAVLSAHRELGRVTA